MTEEVTGVALRQDRPRVLCVDDDERLLAGLQLRLRHRFDVSVANSAATALGKIDRRNPFAVVLSDLKMPQSSGLMLLGVMRRVTPLTVRIILTGYADAATLLTVINEAETFRILVKPVDGELLLRAVEDAVEHHKSLISERDIVVQTLAGVSNIVSETLALANPVVAARASRVRRLAGEICERISPRDRWLVELAALASQVGYMGVPADLRDRLLSGVTPSPPDAKAQERLHTSSSQLFRDLPRLEQVRESIRLQHVRYDLANTAGAFGSSQDLPLGARILHLASEADALLSLGIPPTDVVGHLEARLGEFDPIVLAALHEELAEQAGRNDVHDLPLRTAAIGMRVLEDVVLPGGVVLIPRGLEITPNLLARIHQLPDDVQGRLVRLGVNAPPRAAASS